jgi:SAM-dependent methyltransferase
MYVKSAQFYDDLYHFKDYSVAAEELLQMIRHLHREAETLLDVGCSTGLHLSHLHDKLRVEGLDISDELLAHARKRLPDVPFHQGDMTGFDLGKTFDVVTCLFASIAYVCTQENLHRAVAHLAHHVSPGGLLFIEPWLSPAQYWRDHVVMNVVDKPDRKIAWSYVGKENDNIVTNDIHFLVAAKDGVTSFVERHRMGLFDEGDYKSAFSAAGMTILHQDPCGFFGNGLYVARRG